MDLRKNRSGSHVGFRRGAGSSGSHVGFRRSARPAETLGEFRYLRSLERKIYGYSLWFAINDTTHAIKIGIKVKVPSSPIQTKMRLTALSLSAVISLNIPTEIDGT